MCGSCVAKVTPTLNKVIGQDNWKVDTSHASKILTVTASSMSESEVIETVEKAGYKSEKIT